MEATALSIGKSVLNGALSYAKSALAEEVALQLGVRRDQVFITNELEMMKAFLESAHDEGDDNRVVKVWVTQVRDVAYDVEDTLQEFSVCLKKQSWWRIHRTLQDRHHVAKQMKELRANVEDVSQRNMRYNLIKGSGSRHAATGDNSAITGAKMSGMDERKRQHDKAKLDLIRLISQKDDNLRVIAVSGTSTGRLEKMSVIKSAYDDRSVHMKFECRAWITGFMSPFCLTEFLQSIIEQFHLNILQETGGKEKTKLEVQVLRRMGMMKEDDLVDEFMRYLSEKTYLIVLNGINTIKDWAHLKPCFRDSKKGSRIIVSSEQVGVASLCVGREDAAPEYMRFFADESIYAFYEKGSHDGTDSLEAVSTSNADTASGDSSANMKTLNRKQTLLTPFKESQLIGRETEKNKNC
uniref:Rx N-terminal domain-containing protein n=1 Tax=Hordeum vulgare subsp. vulgare TaxID=112509 RepID=A0A8I6WDU2_HORVV